MSNYSSLQDTTSVFLVVALLSCSSATLELLPGYSQKVIDLNLPNRPSSLAAITVTTKTLKWQVFHRKLNSSVQSQGNIYLSSSYSGNLNTWVLNISNNGSNQLVTEGILCFDPKMSKLDKNENMVTVVAFSNIGKDQSINIRTIRNSKAFLYLVPIVSLFYLIPSGQMVYAEQQREKVT